MNSHTPLGDKSAEQTSPKAAKRMSVTDILMLALAVIVLVAGFVLPYFPNPIYEGILPLSPYVGVLLSGLIFLFLTSLGRAFIAYVKSAFAELKKVVWPPRQEALRMTGFVIVFVAILSLFIYGVDTIISWLFFDVFLRRG